jgi:hypothetical protein
MAGFVQCLKTKFFAVLIVVGCVTTAFAADYPDQKVLPSYPRVPFDVPAGSKITISSIKQGQTSHIIFERSLTAPVGDTFKKFRKYWAGTGEIIPAESQGYSYIVFTSYFGDFGSGYGPGQIQSTDWSNNGKTVAVKFIGIKGQPLPLLKIEISP